MAKLINKKLNASTLVEVLISLVIMMAVFTIAISIYMKITSSGSSSSTQRAHQQMRSMLQQSVGSTELIAEQISIDSIVYQKDVEVYPDYKDLMLVRVEAIQQGKSLGILQQVVQISEVEEETAK